MRFIIISIILHIIVMTYGYSFKKEKSFQVDTVGTTMSSDNIAVNFNQRKVIQEEAEKVSEPVPEEEVVEEKIIEDKIVEKQPETIETKEIIRKVLPTKEKEKPKKEVQKKKEPKKIVPPKETSVVAPPTQEGLIEISKGIFAAKNQGIKGISYSFISNPDPEYPELAKRMGYKKEVGVKVRFLVGLDGRIEEIKFYNNEKDLGFKGEVEKVLKEWKLTPVTLKGQKIKLYFYKEFKFNYR